MTVGVLLLVANGAVGIGERTVPSGLAALLVAPCRCGCSASTRC